MRRNRTIFAEHKPRRTGRLIYPLFLLLILALSIGLNFINNGRVRLDTESVTIVGLPKELENFRILHISDLHGNEYGANQNTIATMLQTARYNAVCVTGDVCAPDGDYSAFLKLIDLFAGKVPVYFIAGDEDPAPLLSAAQPDGSVKADYILAAEEHGAIYVDRPQKLAVGKSVIWFSPESIYGLDIASYRAAYQARLEALAADDSLSFSNQAAQISVIDHQLQMLADTEQYLAEMQDSDIQIALTHHPLTEETIKTLQQWAGAERGDFFRGVSLVLSGHFCAGQIRIPFVGALRAPASAGLPGSGWFPADRALTGLSVVQGVTQYISPGLGASGAYPVRFRMFNTPAVTVLTLTSKLTF